MQKPAYKIDLSAYIHACESNYVRLLKLLPRYEDARCYQLSLHHQIAGNIALSVKESSKYTSVISVDIGTGHEALPSYHFDLRVYYDAAMLEVIAFQGQRRIQAHYPYPNQQMRQRDEKLQQQLFLADCLNSCLEHGLGSIELAYA